MTDDAMVKKIAAALMRMEPGSCVHDYDERLLCIRCTRIAVWTALKPEWEAMEAVIDAPSSYYRIKAMRKLDTIREAR